VKGMISWSSIVSPANMAYHIEILLQHGLLSLEPIASKYYINVQDIEN
jgi:hypothetical protein